MCSKVMSGRLRRDGYKQPDGCLMSQCRTAGRLGSPQRILSSILIPSCSRVGTVHPWQSLSRPEHERIDRNSPVKTRLKGSVWKSSKQRPDQHHLVRLQNFHDYQTRSANTSMHRYHTGFIDPADVGFHLDVDITLLSSSLLAAKISDSS